MDKINMEQEKLLEIIDDGYTKIVHNDYSAAFDILFIPALTDESVRSVYMILPRTTYPIFMLTDEQIALVKQKSEEGYAVAQYTLGRYCFLVRKNDDSLRKAKDLFKKAMDQDFAEAIFSYARMLIHNMDERCEEGIYYDDRPEFKEFVRLREVAMQKGSVGAFCSWAWDKLNDVADKDPESLINILKEKNPPTDDKPELYFWLGRAYEKTGEKDKARDAYFNAISSGYYHAVSDVIFVDYCDDEGNFIRGNALDEMVGFGIKNNDAFSYLIKALMEMEDYGEADPSQQKAIHESIKLNLEKSFSLGCNISAFYLGNHYRDGNFGFDEDKEKAWIWYLDGFCHDDVNSYAALADMYENGDAPDGITEYFKAFCNLMAYRLGDNDRLVKVIADYKAGKLNEYKDEIEKYYIPRLTNEDVDFEDEDDGFEEYDDFENGHVVEDVDFVDEDGIPLEATDESFGKYMKICNSCIEKARNDLQEMRNQWEIAGLARTFLKYATYMEGFDHLLDYLYEAVGNMNDCVFEHPRLKLKLLELYLLVINRIEAKIDHDLSFAEDVRADIVVLESNIAHADKGEFDKIKDSRSLKHDPVEWTARWEEVIDEADKIADENLENVPRGMGFCFSHWHERAAALRKFGIEWKNPHQMNPRVMFD